MSIPTKIDYSGLARTGLEVFSSSDGATNQLLEVADSSGDIVATEAFGHVKSPHVEFKITGDLAFTSTNVLTLGKVYGASGTPSASGPYALRAVSASTGAGEEPTFSVDLVQLQSGATQARCTYDLGLASLSPARHAQAFGAITFTESATLTLQSAEYSAECDLTPTTINGDPKCADAVRAKETVSVTMWSTAGDTQPTVTVASGWTQTADWAVSGADSQLFAWTATFSRYPTSTEQS